MVFKYIIPAVAVINGAYAQCSAASATTTLSANTDAGAIAGCATYTGSIALATGIAGDISLDGIQQITGSLAGSSINNVTSISANTLQSIGGSFSLGYGTILNTLNFPALTSVNGLSLQILGPRYQSTGFSNLTSVGSLTIIDTSLQSLNGITLTSAQDVTIAQNSQLNTIALGLTELTGALSITANADGSCNASFPKLSTVMDMTIQNVSSLTLSSLNNSTGTLGLAITGNTFTSLNLPALTSVTSGFAVNNNNQMTNMSVPKLQTVGAAINVQNNSDFTSNVSFPALTLVTGSANLIGDFSGVSMPDLNTIQGSMTINSTADISSTCSHFSSLGSSQGGGSVVKGVLTCNGGTGTTEPGSSSSGSSGSGSASGTGSASSSSATKTSAASLAFEPAQASAFTVFGLLAAVFGLLM